MPGSGGALGAYGLAIWVLAHDSSRSSELPQKIVCPADTTSVSASWRKCTLFGSNTAPRSSNDASQQQPTSLYAQHNLSYKHCNAPTLLGVKEHERCQCNTQQKVCRRIEDFFPRLGARTINVTTPVKSETVRERTDSQRGRQLPRNRP